MNEINPTAKFRMTDRYVMAHVGTEVVLAPISASTADMSKITSVNSTGAEILDLLMAGNDFGGTVARLVETYGEENRKAVEGDARAFVGKMLSQGVIEATE